MASVNERLLEAEVSHAIGLQRYSTGVMRRMMAILNRADSDLMARLAAALDRVPQSTAQIERLDDLLFSVRQLSAQVFGEIQGGMTNEMRVLVEYEVGFQRRLFESAIPVPVQAHVSFASVSVEQVAAAAMSRPFSVSKDGAVPLRDYLAGIEEGRARMIRDAVRLGFIEGESIPQIMRRIRGTRARGYADGLMEGTRRHIEGMVRTAVNHTANYARQSFYEANADLVRGWTFVATLDGRTSITCASLSGKEFPLGRGPMPPRHINCRSSSVPRIASWRELGIDQDELPASTRASMDGQIAENITFTQWLRSKPASVQDDILGATRGKLFRANKIEIDRFTDNKGRVYSLDDLRKRDADIFARAGLE